MQTPSISIPQHNDARVGMQVVCALTDSHRCTVNRWTKNPETGFPKPQDINGRPHWRLGDIIEWLSKRPAYTADKLRGAARLSRRPETA
jgi:predicted DNA-binding transcriptional regulator AlpA